MANDTTNTGPVLTHEPAAAADGTLAVTVSVPGGESYTDRVVIADPAARSGLAERIGQRFGGLARADIEAELEAIAATVVTGADAGGGGGRASQTDRLVELVESEPGMELFHTAGGCDAQALATVPVGSHLETWPLTSKGFRHWLSRQFYIRYKKVAGGQAVQDALGVLAGKAVHEGPERASAVRLCEHGGCVYLDLADEHWRAVRIAPGSWEVLGSADVPVRFIRRRGVLPLPVPARGGHVDGLRDLVNVPSPDYDDHWRLIVAWMVATLRPGRPFPILVINGEHGSAKSTLSRMLRGIIDPNAAPLRSPPRDERDLVIAASNGWIVGYDNLSGISTSMSDAICRLATGGGYGTRELFSDDEEKLFSATRPVLLNGIDDVATRPDAIDRSLCVTLPVIRDERRRDEDELWRRYAQARPGVLGSLLDAAAGALSRVASVSLPLKPRMADFAMWATAAEPALGWEQGSLVVAYAANRAGGNELALESSIIGPAVLSLVAKEGRYEGTATEMLAALEAGHADERTRKRKEWPGSAKGLSEALKRIAPNLRASGIEVTIPERRSGRGHRRVIVLEEVPERRCARFAQDAPPPPEPPPPPPAHLAHHAHRSPEPSSNGTVQAAGEWGEL